MNIQTLEPSGFETMTRREKREAQRDILREEFRRALWALTPTMSRADIRELFEEEIKL